MDELAEQVEGGMAELAGVYHLLDEETRRRIGSALNEFLKIALRFENEQLSQVLALKPARNLDGSLN